MNLAKIRFLQAGEESGYDNFPKRLKEAYIRRWRPYWLKEETGVPTGILRTTAENSMDVRWRKAAKGLLERWKREGVEIVVSALEGELPQEILPLADGKRLMQYFAFAGAAQAVRRQGKEPAQCRYLLVGGRKELWQRALCSMGNEGNHLAICTAEPAQAKALAEKLYEERGLIAEVFSSVKNPLFSQADAVLCCGMEPIKYEHILGKGAVFLDLVGNRTAMRRLQAQREDVAAADGFYFRQGQVQEEGRLAEAKAFLSCESLRKHWEERFFTGAEVFVALEEKGYAVSGFSAGEERVKIQKNQGFSKRKD